MTGAPPLLYALGVTPETNTVSVGLLRLWVVDVVTVTVQVMLGETPEQVRVTFEFVLLVFGLVLPRDRLVRLQVVGVVAVVVVVWVSIRFCS